MAQASIQLGSIGIWTRLEDQPAAKAQETVRELEELGYGAFWFGEAAGREALTNAGLLLAATKRMVIATGIANIYARDAVAMASGQKTLAEAYPNRFLLGLGVSHVPLVEQLRGHHEGVFGSHGSRPVQCLSARDETRASAGGAGAEDAGTIGAAGRWRASLQHQSGTYGGGAEDPGAATVPLSRAGGGA